METRQRECFQLGKCGVNVLHYVEVVNRSDIGHVSTVTVQHLDPSLKPGSAERIHVSQVRQFVQGVLDVDFFLEMENDLL